MASEILSELEELNNIFEDLFGKQDFKGLAETLFTADCRLMAPERELIIGREGTAELISTYSTDSQVRMEMKVLEVIPAGDCLLIERGTSTLYHKGGAVAKRVKYMHLRRKECGQWMIHFDMINSGKE